MGRELDSKVQDQYEHYPYPHRDPADEDRRLIAGSPSHLDEIRHYLHGGRLDLSDPDRPFRALVAGGGTGDAAIMLAQQLADAGAAHAEVIYLDLSSGSRAIAEARAARRGLGNMRFLTGTIEQAADLVDGPVDYIDCCGVLHHLDSPEAGLRALAGLLSDRGGMGLMVYGTLGRTGVYAVQEALAQLADDLPDKARLAAARTLLQELPATHWLKRNPFVGDHLKGDDAGLYDLLLHRRDRAYRVAEFAELIAGAGLSVRRWIEPARYDPATYLTDPKLLARAAALDPPDRAALAERLSGAMAKHIAYVAPNGRDVAEPDPGAEDSVLVFRDLDPAAVANGLKPSGTLSADMAGTPYRAALPALAPRIAALIDGTRTVAAIKQALREQGTALPADGNFADQVRKLFAAFNGINRMLVRQAGG